MGMLHLFPHHRPGGAVFYFLHGHGLGGMAVPVIFGVALYLYVAICLYALARKTGTNHAWMAWIPVLNVYLLCTIGGKPGWWTALLFIPVVNVFFAILVFMAIAEARSKPYWWGVLIAIPLIRAVVPGYLAFSGSKGAIQASAAA